LAKPHSSRKQGDYGSLAWTRFFVTDFLPGSSAANPNIISLGITKPDRSATHDFYDIRFFETKDDLKSATAKVFPRALTVVSTAAGMISNQFWRKDFLKVRLLNLLFLS